MTLLFAFPLCRVEGNPPQWVAVEHGLPAVIASQDALQLSVCDPVSGEQVCEFQITENSGYNMDEDYFHSFVCVDEWDVEETYGLSFAEEIVGKAAGTIILQLIPHARGLASLDMEGRMDVAQGEAPPPSSDMEARTDVDQGKTSPPSSQKGRRVWKNIRRFFSSRRQFEGGVGRAAEREQRKLEISGPSNFQHISHGGGPIMYSSTKPVQSHPFGAQPTHPSTIRKGRKREASPEDPPRKKKKTEISDPKDFRHVSHIGPHNFGMLDKAGQEDIYAVQGGGEGAEEGGGEEAVDKRASSLRPSSVVSLEISEPFDMKHIAHVDKSDPLVQLLTSQSNKTPFEASAVASGEGDTAPPSSKLAKPISSNEDILLAPADSGGSQTSQVVTGSEIKVPQVPQEPAHKPAVQSQETGQPGMECGPVLYQSRSSLLSQGSSGAWSEISQCSSQDTERQTSTEGLPSPEVGQEEGAHSQTADSACQTEPASSPPPPPPPPPPPVVLVTPMDRLPPVQFDHDSFLQEIEGFDPSQLRRAGDRVLPRAPPSHRFSMQTMMRSSFDKMKEKLHSVWRESVFAYIAEDDEFGEEEFDFGQLI